VEAWVRTTSFKYHWVLGKYDRNGGERGYHLIIKDGKAAFAGRDGSGHYRNSGYTTDLVNDGQWHHLTGVSHSGIWQIYIDGILKSEFRSGYPATNLTNTAPLVIGKDFLSNNENFDGEIDEVRIWKKVPPIEEIRRLMCSKIPNPQEIPDLVAYYNFDNLSSSTVRDLSLNKMDGTLRNVSPAAASVISSAPIGDKSLNTYILSEPNASPAMHMQENGYRFHASNLNWGTQGYHIYFVNAKPNTTTGIADPAQVNSYFGIFQVGNPQQTHYIHYYLDNAFCKQSLYHRAHNAAQQWSLIKTVPVSDPLRYDNMHKQAEFAYTTTSTVAPSIQSSGDFCQGGQATLQINTTSEVLWSTGERSKSITVNRPGDYSVTVSQDGCTFTDQVTIKEIALPEVNLGPDRSLCGGEQAILEAPAGNYTYKWSTGATSRAIEAKTSGKYWVEVTNTNGCSTRDEVTVEVKPQPAISLQQELTACYGERITVDATTTGATYLWSTGQTTATVNVAAPVTLSVAITVNGCTYTREVTVSSDECPLIPNIITPNGDGKNDTFVLQGINIDQVEIEIFNRWGASVYKRTSYDNKWAGASGGMYYYHIISRQTDKVYKGWVEVVR
jgi:gliding motility-associated-like protein